MMDNSTPAEQNRVPVSIARQPIFDEQRYLWGYALFCVGTATNVPSGLPRSNDVAFNLASSAYIGLQQILAHEKKIVVSFDEKSILDKLAYALPPAQTAIQVEERVAADPPVRDLLTQFKTDGFLLAISNYSGDQNFAALYALADVICLDACGRSKEELAAALSGVRAYPAQLMATRVDDGGYFNICRELGFDLFQGAFFKLPEVVPIKKLSSNEVARFNLLKMIEDDAPDIDRLTETIQADLSISYRLMAYLNSAAFGFRQKIKSIQHAVALLGWRKIKNWLRVVLLTDMGQGADTTELVLLAAQRGKFLELLAHVHDYWGFNPESLHLLGLFSLLDAVLGAPMQDVVSYLPLENKLKDALCGKPNNEYGPLLELARYLEEARWADAEAMMQQLNLDNAKTKAAFQQAIEWAAELTSLHQINSK